MTGLLAHLKIFISIISVVEQLPQLVNRPSSWLSSHNWRCQLNVSWSEAIFFKLIITTDVQLPELMFHFNVKVNIAKRFGLYSIKSTEDMHS